MIPRVTPENTGKNTHSENRAAPGAATDPVNGPIDPDLAAIIERWADLPQAVRAAMIAMVRATALFANQE